MEWLRRAVGSNAGFDPLRERLFGKLHDATEFQALAGKARKDTPPISASRLFAIVREADLFPENFAYDPETKAFFIGSTVKNEVMRCHPGRACELFAGQGHDSLGHVLGLKIHPPSETLWVTSNTDNGASLRRYRLASGELIGDCPLPGPHLFNDLAVSAGGDVFVTDTKGGAVYKLAARSRKFERLAPEHEFTAANGIALSADERRIFVANFGDGITTVDLATRSAKPMPHPAGVCLGYIDGLYATKNALIAIQNGPMTPRIVRFVLNPGGEITSMRILEQRNPWFDGLTTGTLVADRFYYIANSQLDNVVDGKIKPGVRLDALRILAIDVRF